MAILYGTTADGDSLPVEVNEFGQLVAQGLDGPIGPPGPPGLPELPPDPFEGAILGWKDNTLAWLGGSVPLPPGTYGPITAYADGILTLESAVDLPYLASIYLSDAQGAPYFYNPITSDITQVVSGPTVLNVDGRSIGNNPQTLDAAKRAFDGNTSTYFGFITGGAYPNGSARWLFTYPIDFKAGDVVEAMGTRNNNGGAGVTFSDNTSLSVDAGPLTLSENKTVVSIFAGSGGTHSDWGNIWGVKCNGVVLVNGQYPLQTFPELSLLDDAGLNEFRVGDVIQGPGVIVDQISMNPPLLTAVGGTWSVGDRVVGPEKSGTGTVQSTLNDSIVLRDNNDQWIVGQYVTAPSQSLAARYVMANKKSPERLS